MFWVLLVKDVNEKENVPRFEPCVENPRQNIFKYQINKALFQLYI